MGEVDREVALMRGETALPRKNGELVFEAPWQARAFGMAVALAQQGRYAWDDFRCQLIGRADAPFFEQPLQRGQPLLVVARRRALVRQGA